MDPVLYSKWLYKISTKLINSSHNYAFISLLRYAVAEYNEILLKLVSAASVCLTHWPGFLWLLNDECLIIYQ